MTATLLTLFLSLLSIDEYGDKAEYALYADGSGALTMTTATSQQAIAVTWDTTAVYTNVYYEGRRKPLEVFVKIRGRWFGARSRQWYIENKLNVKLWNTKQGIKY